MPFGRPRHFTRVERAFGPFPETMATWGFLLLRSSLVIAFCLIFNDLILYFVKPLFNAFVLCFASYYDVPLVPIHHEEQRLNHLRQYSLFGKPSVYHQV
jgi:hypothetical protein